MQFSSRIGRGWHVLTALLLTLTCAASAVAQSGAVTKRGAIVDGRLNSELSSKTAHEGDPFTLTITDTLFHHHHELKGAVVDGHVENVTPASSTHKATMSLVFDDIAFPGGQKEPVSVTLAKLSQVEPKTHHIRDIGLIIGGAVAGHVVSKKTGHGGGTFAGAAAGFALASSLKSNIDLKPGTLVELKLLHDLPAPAGT